MNDFLDIDPSAITDFNKTFDKIANKLINSYILVAGNNQYQIAELEFYLYCDEHDDTFTHCSIKQLSSSQWYVHPRSGTYKGLDITFSLQGYGGILIRALKHNNEYIEGPCKVVEELMQCTNSISPTELSNILTSSVFDTTQSIYLKSCTNKHISLYNSPRVGLKLKNSAHFFFAPYRYVCYPNLVTKAKHSLILELYLNNCDVSEFVTHNVLTRWLQSFDNACNTIQEDYYNKTLSVAQYCSLRGLIYE